jgi:ADP-dependent NAD(P)H-hydrate dehydratase / NAD(P)H-hydrate epimerase
VNAINIPMQILSAKQIRELDEFTIVSEPISSIDLMERAASSCADILMAFLKTEEPIYVLCGQGNNGGDGLALGRILMDKGYSVSIFVIKHRLEFSADSKINLERFAARFPDDLYTINDVTEFKEALKHKKAVVIDALLGSGTNKPVEGLLGEVIKTTNEHFEKIISIDLPSGLYADSSSQENKNIIRSSLTLTLQFPKLALLMPENGTYVGEFIIVDIGLNEKAFLQPEGPLFYITKKDVTALLRPRPKFSHKGTFGHALLLAGSKGKSGAAIICAKACLRSGAGLLTIHSTKEVLLPLLIHLPEAMTNEDPNELHISDVDIKENYAAVGIGPGLGLNEETIQTFKKLLHYHKGKMVLDADALNMLSENKTWLDHLPSGTILTPHPKEFERLAGKVENDFERIELLQKFSVRYNCIVILKGAHTCVAMPDGNLFFNSSGNPGLAKAGSGDALTGIVLGLLCRGYSSAKAALLGTFLHGLAADLCLQNMSDDSILISDVIEKIPESLKVLETFRSTQ